jgi:lipoprotein-releasing system ATP-binding protein
MPSLKPTLQAKGIQKFLGSDLNSVHVLRGVDLELMPGHSYSIVGPSGCGKSTLLYLLGLLDRQNEGEIVIGGRSATHASEVERTEIRNMHIGFVFQFHFLLAEFTAAENVMLPMSKLGKRSPEEMREIAFQLLSEVGLGNKVNRLATQLSGGEQQRVAVARALANQPSIILADEPTGNLDVNNSNVVFELLCRLARQHGQSVLMVTHNPDLAKRTDFVLPMKDGLFVEDEKS